MKVLLIIFISIFYFCFSKAHINKFGEVYIRSETKSEVISINANRIDPYTEENNDCLYLRINKHYGRILCIDYIENIRFANSELDVNNLGNIL